MANRKQIILLAVLFLVATAISASAQIPRTEGTISKVTVYHGQALVTRNIEIGLPTGSSELIVENLPANIISESIYAVTSGPVRVLSVRYRQQAVREDTREEIRQLDAQIEELNKQINQTTRRKEHLDNQWSMFIRLREFTVEAKDEDINRGLLAFEPISNLAEFIQVKGQEYIEQTLAYEEQIDELNKELELLNRSRQELSAGRSRTEREAVLFLNRTGSGTVNIELNYLVEGANWQQQYNLRAEPENSNVLIEYNAVVNQTSGENWDSVVLSLSTAEPTMVSAAPVLEPMLVSLTGGQIAMQQQVALQSDEYIMQEMVSLQNSRLANIGKGLGANEELNRLAFSNQAIIFNADEGQLQRLREQVVEITQTEGISVTYELPGRLTLPSRSDQQLITIASIETEADFTLIATPLLTDYVYLQADVLNNSQTVLLPGQSSMFCDGQFVGKSNMPLVTMGQKFTAGFGIDSQVQVTHELEDKQTRIQGGNRIDTYNYRIALSNYKATPVELRLLDRLPYTENDSIKIEMLEAEPQLSQNNEYQSSLADKGILRWDLELAPNTTDQQATIVSYSYTMEYDRNMNLQTSSSELP